MEDMLRGLSAKDTERLSALLQIEEDYETGKIDLKEARRQLSEKVGRVHPYDIAKAEQHLVPADDEECRKVDMKKTLQLLDGFLDTSRPDLPADHPIMLYYRENDEMRKYLAEVENLLQFPLIKNQWLELYEALLQYPVHYTRKQNQLYPLLEKKALIGLQRRCGLSTILSAMRLRRLSACLMKIRMMNSWRTKRMCWLIRAI